MKQFILVWLLAACLLACNEQEGNAIASTSTPDTLTNKTAAVVGGDSDSHGCKASAGYQWSELQQTCIRPFELPVKIISADSTTQTGIIISEDRNQAEVFAPSGHYLLNKKMEFQYESSDGKIHLYIDNKGEWVLKTD